ncbi:unnamed protein product [Amoebophrya sp. A120]|nr:unnamed protein product [Amoebophrya sp. A120]|eukprot:GSA120T00012647001.1
MTPSRPRGRGAPALLGVWAAANAFFVFAFESASTSLNTTSTSTSTMEPVSVTLERMLSDLRTECLLTADRLVELAHHKHLYRARQIELATSSAKKQCDHTFDEAVAGEAEEACLDRLKSFLRTAQEEDTLLVAQAAKAVRSYRSTAGATTAAASFLEEDGSTSFEFLDKQPQQEHDLHGEDKPHSSTPRSTSHQPSSLSQLESRRSAMKKQVENARAKERALLMRQEKQVSRRSSSQQHQEDHNPDSGRTLAFAEGEARPVLATHGVADEVDQITRLLDDDSLLKEDDPLAAAKFASALQKTTSHGREDASTGGRSLTTIQQQLKAARDQRLAAEGQAKEHEIEVQFHQRLSLLEKKEASTSVTTAAPSTTSHTNTTEAIIRMESVIQILDRMATQIVDEMQAVAEIRATSFAQTGEHQHLDHTTHKLVRHEVKAADFPLPSKKPPRALAAGIGAPDIAPGSGDEVYGDDSATTDGTNSESDFSTTFLSSYTFVSWLRDLFSFSAIFSSGSTTTSGGDYKTASPLTPILVFGISFALMLMILACNTLWRWK